MAKAWMVKGVKKDGQQAMLNVTKEVAAERDSRSLENVLAEAPKYNGGSASARRRARKERKALDDELSGLRELVRREGDFSAQVGIGPRDAFVGMALNMRNGKKEG